MLFFSIITDLFLAIDSLRRVVVLAKKLMFIYYFSFLASATTRRMFIYYLSKLRFQSHSEIMTQRIIRNYTVKILTSKCDYIVRTVEPRLLQTLST